MASEGEGSAFGGGAKELGGAMVGGPTAGGPIVGRPTAFGAPTGGPAVGLGRPAGGPIEGGPPALGAPAGVPIVGGLPLGTPAGGLPFGTPAGGPTLGGLPAGTPAGGPNVGGPLVLGVPVGGPIVGGPIAWTRPPGLGCPTDDLPEGTLDLADATMDGEGDTSFGNAAGSAGGEDSRPRADRVGALQIAAGLDGPEEPQRGGSGKAEGETVKLTSPGMSD